MMLQCMTFDPQVAVLYGVEMAIFLQYCIEIRYLINRLPSIDEAINRLSFLPENITRELYAKAITLELI